VADIEVFTLGTKRPAGWLQRGDYSFTTDMDDPTAEIVSVPGKYAFSSSREEAEYYLKLTRLYDTAQQQEMADHQVNRAWKKFQFIRAADCFLIRKSEPGSCFFVLM
jgi:hypothetical protein